MMLYINGTMELGLLEKAVTSLKKKMEERGNPTLYNALKELERKLQQTSEFQMCTRGREEVKSIQDKILV